MLGCSVHKNNNKDGGAWVWLQGERWYGDRAQSTIGDDIMDIDPSHQCEDVMSVLRRVDAGCYMFAR